MSLLKNTGMGKSKKKKLTTNFENFSLCPHRSKSSKIWVCGESREPLLILEIWKKLNVGCAWRYQFKVVHFWCKTATSCTRFVHTCTLHTQENFIVQPGKRMLSKNIGIQRFRSRNKITNFCQRVIISHQRPVRQGPHPTYIHMYVQVIVLPSIDHVAVSPKILFTDGKSLSYTDRGQSFPLPRPPINQVYILTINSLKCFHQIYW